MKNALAGLMLKDFSNNNRYLLSIINLLCYAVLIISPQTMWFYRVSLADMLDFLKRMFVCVWGGLHVCVYMCSFLHVCMGCGMVWLVTNTESRKFNLYLVMCKKN